jgi:diguanylate cyclase (GGDEF)-like protein
VTVSNELPTSELLAAVPHVVVRDGMIVDVGPEVANELECAAEHLLGPLAEIGTRLDDTGFDDLCRGLGAVRVRLGPELNDRPVRLRRLGAHGDRIWIEVRSLASEFRLESLLRRTGFGHMLISPAIELQWSMTSNEMSEVFPGDNPLNWVELMDPDDMQVLGRAIHKVGADPTERRTVRHRLHADRTHTIIDTVESALHDPDLRAVLVRSRLEDSALAESGGSADPSAGVTVSDHMPIGVVVASTTGKVLHRNAVAGQLVGARAGQAVTAGHGDSWMLDSLGAEHAAQYQDVYQSAAAGRAAHCTVPSPLAANRWLRISASPATASTVVMIIEDVTELTEAERALRASNRLLDALDSHSEEFVVVFDDDGRVRYTSSSFRRHLGAGVKLEHADDFLEHVHVADRALVTDLERRVRSSAPSGEVQFRASFDDPAGRWHHGTMTNLLDDPDVHGLVLTVRDVHERHLAERELHFRATHDALTSLPDRAALQARLGELLREAARLGHRTALLFCDVDHFKSVNDRCGHHVGDLVLTEVATRLRSALRVADFVGRFGGDEFVVVVPDVDDDAHALALAERVFATTMGPLKLDDVEIDVSLSMGLAITDAAGTTADDLLRRADAAMYRSKRRGRGRLSLYSARGDGDRDGDGGGDGRDGDAVSPPATP